MAPATMFQNVARSLPKSHSLLIPRKDGYLSYALTFEQFINFFMLFDLFSCRHFITRLNNTNSAWRLEFAGRKHVLMVLPCLIMKCCQGDNPVQRKSRTQQYWENLCLNGRFIYHKQTSHLTKLYSTFVQKVRIPNIKKGENELKLRVIMNEFVNEAEFELKISWIRPQVTFLAIALQTLIYFGYL